MTMPRRRFRRSLGERRYRQLFVIATEGAVTEPAYFELFNEDQVVVRIRCLKSKTKNSPGSVLERLKHYLKEENLRKKDEAWLVVDLDQWTEEQLHELYVWSCQSDCYGFAVSNPKFEYWLLLHFEETKGSCESRECSKRLQQYLPEYDKTINRRHFTPDRIDQAVRRAELRDNPPCSDWPRKTGTTVYRLVKKILSASRGRSV